jgi:hypothetical protein
MNAFLPFRHSRQLSVLCGLVLTLALAAGCSHSPAPPSSKPKTETAKTNAVGTVQANSTNDYVSVFEDLPPEKGRDPFYPASHRRDLVPESASQAAVRVDPVLVLKAIVRASKHGEVVINDQILETGEEESVRVPGGHVLVRCLEVGNDYVLVRVEGDAEAKRLMIDNKKY